MKNMDGTTKYFIELEWIQMEPIPEAEADVRIYCLKWNFKLSTYINVALNILR